MLLGLLGAEALQVEVLDWANMQSTVQRAWEAGFETRSAHRLLRFENLYRRHAEAKAAQVAHQAGQNVPDASA